MSNGQNGLAFLGILVCANIAFLVVCLWTYFIYEPAYKREGADLKPEIRCVRLASAVLNFMPAQDAARDDRLLVHTHIAIDMGLVCESRPLDGPCHWFRLVLHRYACPGLGASLLKSAQVSRSSFRASSFTVSTSTPNVRSAVAGKRVRSRPSCRRGKHFSEYRALCLCLLLTTRRLATIFVRVCRIFDATC